MTDPVDVDDAIALIGPVVTRYAPTRTHANLQVRDRADARSCEGQRSADRSRTRRWLRRRVAGMTTCSGSTSFRTESSARVRVGQAHERFAQTALLDGPRRRKTVHGAERRSEMTSTWVNVGPILCHLETNRPTKSSRSGLRIRERPFTRQPIGAPGRRRRRAEQERRRGSRGART